MKKLLLLLLLPAFVACTQIDTGNVGVTSSMGQVKKEVLPAGVHFTGLSRITEVSGKELLVSMPDMKPQTSDKITLTDLDVDLYIQIDPSKASEIMTRWPGDVTEVKGEDGSRIGFNYVTRQAREAIFHEVANYKSDIVHTKRSEISAGVVKELQASLDESAGKGWFFVRSANVTNLITDPALDASIKQAAQRQFEIDAKKKEVLLAEAEADRKRAEARGDADAIRLRAAAITSNGGADYVQLEAIKKWDGKLPATMAGNATPFIHVK